LQCKVSFNGVFERNILLNLPHLLLSSLLCIASATTFSLSSPRSLNSFYRTAERLTIELKLKEIQTSKKGRKKTIQKKKSTVEVLLYN